jgi:outer membrane receptor protein involved in Fe transport
VLLSHVLLEGGIEQVIVLLAAAAAQVAASPDSIVVTGERVTRTVRDTASSVEVLTQREMEAAGADRVRQMLALVPNVQLGNGSQGPAIRGLDTTGPLQALPAFLGGNRPRTTLVVDGRAVTYNEFLFGAAPAWDLARIEVFRSPQTTTQGVNSIAGAIFVTSNDPSSTPEARARLIAGDHGMRQSSALVSGPLSADAAMRVAGDLRYSRTSSAIVDDMAGADPNHDVFGLLRAKLLITPRRMRDSRLLLTYVHSHSQAPQTVGVSAPFRARRDQVDGYGVFRVKVDSLTGSLRQQVATDVTANFLLTGGRSNARRYAIPGLGEARNRSRDWSAEAVLNWSGEGPLRFVGGVSHLHVALRQSIDLSLLSGLKGTFRDWQDGTGAFGEASLKVASKATLTAGLRYQHDRQKRQGALVANTFSVPADFIGTFHALLPKLSFSYDLSRDWRAGIMVQKAYNPGGTTIRFDTARPDNFAAESLWDTEIFARGSLAGGRLRLAANLFNYAMRDAQRAEPIVILTPTRRPVGFANLFNVPRARSRGFELSVRARPNQQLSGWLALGLLGTKFTRTDAESAGYRGRQFDRSPHFSGAAGVDWTPLPALQLSAQVRRHSSYFSDNANSPALRIGPATIADARGEYEIGRLSLFVEVHNAFDRFAMVVLTTSTSGEAEEPRRITVGLERRF